MDYCPEIAVLHGAFALAETKGDDNCSKTSIMFCNQKRQRTGEAFSLIKNALSEIIGGLEGSRPLHEQQKWSKRLHLILFQKAFVYNKAPAGSHANNHGRPGSLELLCWPIPGFHPSLYFELVDDMSWTGFIGEILAEADWKICMDFANACLDYCSNGPAFSNDLNLLATIIDFLLSSVISELLKLCSSNVLQTKGNQMCSMSLTSAGLCWKQKNLDDKSCAEMISCLRNILELLWQWCSKCQTEKKSDLTESQPVLCNRVLPCVLLLTVLSLTPDPSSKMVLTVNQLFVSDDEDDIASLEVKTSEQANHEGTEHLPAVSVSGLQEFVLASLHDAACQDTFMSGIHRLLLLLESSLCDTQGCLHSENNANLGNRISLELKLMGFKQPMKTAEIMKELCTCFSVYLGQQNLAEDSVIKLIYEKVKKIVAEVIQREKEEERKRQNPSLKEVIERIQKRHPHWKACLEYGLAKRDLDSWWLAGFLDFLRTEQKLLHKESDVTHLISIFSEIAQSQIISANESVKEKLAELTLNVFSRLDLATQEKIILDKYQNRALPNLPLVPYFDQALRVTFNKLTVSTALKDLQQVVCLALHDPALLLQYSVQMAVASSGQIPVVIKVFSLMPAVCRTEHPVHHSDCSLLCHCLHSTLLTHEWDSSEQKNFMSLLASLIQTYKCDDKQPPLLMLSDFLTTSVLPFIMIRSPPSSCHPVSADFALRLLICCLDSALSVSLLDWLEEIHPATLIICCADLLQECVVLVTGKKDINCYVRLKALVLTAVGLIEKCLNVPDCSLKGNSLSWVRKVCSSYDWTVVGYLGNIIGPPAGSENSEAISHLLVKAFSTLPSETFPILRLAAISDEAEKKVVQEIWRLRPTIQESILLVGLFQVLPNLLMPEMKRVMRLLSAIIDADCIDIGFRCLFVSNIHFCDLNEVKKEMLSSQLLMDTAILLCRHHQEASHPVFHHLGQLLVAGFQEVLQTADRQECKEGSAALLHFQIFAHICILLSCAPDLMETLFVVLLDILAKQKTVSGTCGTKLRKYYEALFLALKLVPEGSTKENLCKKVEQLNI